MNADDIKKIIEDVSSGVRTVDSAFNELSKLPFSEMGFAKVDSHRPLRNGFSEVIFCAGKRLEHLLSIVEEIDSKGHNAFGTRADEIVLDAVSKKFPKAICDPVSRTFRIINRQVEKNPAKIALLCAGTADVPVAEEARVTAEYFGAEVVRHYDVGVAGLHRLLASIDDIKSADCVIAVAGMEGALPSVVGGLVEAPVIAVPTSVGYGSSFGGVTALLAMLNSCSEGISVVNIDSGFGAACAAMRIIRRNKAKL